MEKVGKFAVIGDGESVTAFMAIGAAVFKVKDEYEAADTLRALAKSDEYAVSLVTEDYAAKMDSLMQKLKEKPYPAVLSVPGASGSNGYGMAGLKKDVEKAVGVDILFNK